VRGSFLLHPSMSPFWIVVGVLSLLFLRLASDSPVTMFGGGPEPAEKKSSDPAGWVGCVVVVVAIPVVIMAGIACLFLLRGFVHFLIY